MSDPQVSEQVAAPVLKIASAWAAVGITSWADAASFVAFCYTLILIAEWAWKKFKAGRKGHSR
jgi:hypothetical protein